MLATCGFPLLLGIAVPLWLPREPLPTSTAKDLADLISAIASLAWPVVAVAIVSWFRPEVRAILSRVRKGEFLGMKFELDELQAKTEAAEATSSGIVSATGSAAGTSAASAEGARVEGAGSKPHKTREN